MDGFNCVIIEDNFLDRLIVEAYTKQHPSLRLIASLSNPVESLDILRSGKVDVLFMDIDMPGMNGMEFFRKIDNRPLCCFITSHPEYAIQAFDVHALDYILKPLKKHRFDQTVQRLEELAAIREKAEQYDLQFEQDILMIKEGTSMNRVATREIIYLEALGNFTRVVTAEKKYTTLMNLGNFMENLPKDKFIRIHRSYAVAVNKIRRMEDGELNVGLIKLPIGKTYKQEINKILGNP
ncbi:MAG: response regulator transcription factor [Williamsia sp.]|nr:response regulator transcription factor [Williamsia sp.]